METSNADDTVNCWKTTPDEAQQWAQLQFQRAQALEATRPYYPRYVHRDPDENGRPQERDVQLASIVAIPPAAVVHNVLRQAQRALGPLAGDPRIRFLPKEIMHLTHHAIYPGRNPQEDEQNIEKARKMAPAFAEFTRQLPAMTLTMDGVTLSDRQLMVTYRGDDGWNAFVQSVAQAEEAFPDLSVAYDVTRSPLQPFGRALQTTIAVFDEGLPMEQLCQRVAPYLPGGPSFVPQRFFLKDLFLVRQEFDPRYVQRFGEVMSRGYMDPMPTRAASRLSAPSLQPEAAETSWSLAP